MSLSALLSHLHNPTTSLPLQSLQNALAHHLVHDSAPTPTPLAATAISSPYYLVQPFTHAKLQSFATSLRHAVHLKYRALLDDAKKRSTLGIVLGRSLDTLLSQWVTDVFHGIQGGHPVLRLAACDGLLQGIEDVKIGENLADKNRVDIKSPRASVENETVVALAEVMDTYSSAWNSQPSNGIEEWEREFQPAGQDILSLALVLASQCLPLVEQHRLEALPLRTLARLLTSTISSAFKNGTFLSSVSASVTLSSEKRVHISPLSPLAQTLQSMSSSHLSSSISSISKLTATILSLLLESRSPATLVDNLFTVSDALDLLREMVKTLERDWISSPLASSSDLAIDQDTQQITQQIWANLKTCLFVTIMLSSSILSASLYVPPLPSTCSITPTTLALQTLHTLSHLAFVISQFGGVTTTTQGFEHLKRTFYMALDILGYVDGQAGPQTLVPNAEAYTRQACLMLQSHRSENAATAPMQAKQALVLAAVEQLIPLLSDKCIRDWVWGICYPHLNNPSHRETYESAHSVVLAIFASYAQRQQQLSAAGAHIVQRSKVVDQTSPWRTPVTHLFGTGSRTTTPDTDGNKSDLEAWTTAARSRMPESAISAQFIQRMIPFYAQCLIENSKQNKLNITQLCLAYAALVRTASVSRNADCDFSTSHLDSHLDGQTNPDDFVLAWYCIQLLLDNIHNLSADVKAKGKAKAIEDISTTVDTQRIHRLQLVLISTVSSLPLPLMVRCLEEVQTLLVPSPSPRSSATTNQPERERRKELLEALFTELLEKTGDHEKEAAVRWWYQHRDSLVRGMTGTADEDSTNGNNDDKGSSSRWLSWRNAVSGSGTGSGSRQKGNVAVGKDMGDEARGGKAVDRGSGEVVRSGHAGVDVLSRL